MTAREIVATYIAFFESRGHKRIPNAPLVPQDDPTTLFTSSGMQPLVPYLLGQPHPLGKRLVNTQNCFRAADIDEVGDNRHTTFFRMLGNWSLGDYFKEEQLPWFFEFLTQKLHLKPERLYVSVFQGFNDIPKDEESAKIWEKLFASVGVDPKDRIFSYGTSKNWWSRSGEPQDMPPGEPGGSDSEVFFDFQTPHNTKYGEHCHINCDCGRFLEIGNSVFMEYQKQKDGSFTKLPQKNVDFGGGLERLLAAVENKQDVFQTSLFLPIIRTIQEATALDYTSHQQHMRIVIDHLVASCFIIASGITPSNKEQGYVLRRLIRRAVDQAELLGRPNLCSIIASIVKQYKDTDLLLVEQFENIQLTVIHEEQGYRKSLDKARTYIQRTYKGKKVGDELKGITGISANDAFLLYTTHGLSPTQIKSLGYVFDERAFAEKMKEHQSISRKGTAKKFAGGLADHQEKTIMGHTATHLLHQALRDILGDTVYQTGSNITTDRIRFDFRFDRKLTDEEMKRVEEIVNERIKENLPVHFAMLDLREAKRLGAIGLFDEKYQEKVKVYFIGAYSKEFCGGPHVDFTGRLKNFTLVKQENLGKGQKRLYAVVTASDAVVT